MIRHNLDRVELNGVVAKLLISYELNNYITDNVHVNHIKRLVNDTVLIIAVNINHSTVHYELNLVERVILGINFEHVVNPNFHYFDRANFISYRDEI